MGTLRAWHFGVMEPWLYSGTEQVLLKDDADQSSKQTRVCLVLRGKPAGNGAGRQGQDSKALLASSSHPQSCLHKLSLGKRQNPEQFTGLSSLEFIVIDIHPRE